MDKLWNEIKRLADSNNGFIRTSDIETAGISRMVLRKYVDAGKLEQIRKGLYTLSDDLADEFALIQVHSPKAIFSYGTHIFDIPVPQGTNISRMIRDVANLRCHYVRPEVYELGVAKTQSPQGATVLLYDKERCVCDLIRDKDKVDIQIYTQAIKDYFHNKNDRRKLLKYTKILGVEEKVRTYMEVL